MMFVLFWWTIPTRSLLMAELKEQSVRNGFIVFVHYADVYEEDDYICMWILFIIFSINITYSK